MLRRFCAFAALVASLLLLPSAAHAAVTHAASASIAGTGSASATLTVPAGSSRYLLVGVSTLESATVTSVTFGAQVLTRETQSAKDSSRAEVWTLKAPNVGTADVTVTVSGNAPFVFGASTFTGVDQTLPVLAAATANQNNSANSASLVLNNTVADDGMFGVISINDAPNITAINSTPSTDTVAAAKRWSGVQGTVLGAGATRGGNTGQNMALNTGINWFWNRIDPANLMPFSNIVIGLKQSVGSAPTVTSPTATSVTHNTATLGGTLSDTGGSPVTSRGVVYCECATPVKGAAGTVTLDAGASDALAPFTVAAAGLKPSTGYTYRAFATNGVGTSYSSTVTFTTQPQPNRAPTANAGGPYSVPEGSSLTLAGSGTDADGDPLVYAWELDGDDDFDDVIGATPTLTRAQLATFGLADGPVTRSIRLGVSDGARVTLSDPTTLSVTNVAPTATVTAPTSVVEGGSATVSFSDQADPGDSSFTYAYDFDGNGSFELTNAPASAAVPASLLADGPATRTVRAAIRDKDGGETVYTKTITVTNAAPTAKVADVTVDEGSTATINVTDADDVAADKPGIRFAYDLVGDGTYGALTADTSATLPAALTADGPGTRTVHVRVADQDGGTTTYTATVTVTNVAPSGTLSNSGPVAEGATAKVSWAGVTDPSVADGAAGTRYRYDFDNDGTWDVTDSALATIDVPAALTADGDEDVTVRAAVVDKDGGARTYTTKIEVDNVAPTAKLTGATVEEGKPATVAFSDQDDVSAADKTAGFTYEYDVDGDGTFEVKSNVPSVTVSTTNGPSTREITGAILDRDGGRTVYKAIVTVENAAPTATLTGDTVDEGAPATVTFSDAHDPSTADAAAGFTYEFDLDGDGVFEVKGTDPKATLKTTDGPATLPVKGAIVDRDGGRREYTTEVVVRNVAPTLTVTGPDVATAGQPVALTLTGADAGGDALTGTIDWGDGTTDAYAATAGHTYGAAGAYTVTVTVRDKDGSETTATHAIAVAAAPAATAPTPAPGTGVLGVGATNLTISGVRVTPRCIRATGLRAVTSAAKTIKVQFRTSAAADVKFRLTRQADKRGASKCPPSTGVAQKGGRKVPGVYSPFSNRSAKAKSGLNTVTLAATGRKGKALKPGTYLLTITAGDVTARTKVWVLAQ